MDMVRFGKTGMKVSKLCLGCMTYGSSKWREWVLEEEASRPFIKGALERGINFFDTADVYSQGASEEILGRALKDFALRHEVVIATKVHGVDGARRQLRRPLAQAHHGGDRSFAEAARHGLRRSLPDPSLRSEHADGGDARGAQRRRARGQGALYRRLVDVGLAIRADDLDRAREGPRRIRLDAELLQSRLSRGRARDDEILRRSGDRGDPVVADGARLSGGLRRRREGGDAARPDRSVQRDFGARVARRTRRSAAASSRRAEKLGTKPAIVALAWVLSKPHVTAPIIGASKPHHLDDALAALALKLDARTIARLEEPYQPKAVVGHV